MAEFDVAVAVRRLPVRRGGTVAADARYGELVQALPLARFSGEPSVTAVTAGSREASARLRGPIPPHKARTAPG